MPELLLELLSEEIPARMQKQAATDLARLLTTALAPLAPTVVKTFRTPRRIAAILEVQPASPNSEQVERGPRRAAPEAAIAGFLRKHNATAADLVGEGEYWVLRRLVSGRPAAAIIAENLPALIRRFPWPKSMRWGECSTLTWVRPLRRILCLLGGAVVPFNLREGDDDGHGLASGDLSEGHRFMAPEPFKVVGSDQWKTELAARKVMLSDVEREATLGRPTSETTLPDGCEIVPDIELLSEIAGLVEWPVRLLGRIDHDFMDLPAEVMRVSMRVNQRYVAVRHADGTPAPLFLFAANIEAEDGGATIVAGNERVLRARFADARHFYDRDRRTKLETFVPALDAVIFHAKLGSQGDRMRRLVRVAAAIAPAVSADPVETARAAYLCKADLLTGMVGEFPELQGIMGGYYAADEGPAISGAIREQYLPKAPSDPVPDSPISIALGLADRLDQLAGFFSIGERPTGSGDPYGLRRAAWGIIRYTWDKPHLRLPLRGLIAEAARGFSPAPSVDELFNFIVERLRVALRQLGERHDVLAAVFAASQQDDLGRLRELTIAVDLMINGFDGADLLVAYRRAANILRIEQKKDGIEYPPEPNASLLSAPAEKAMFDALQHWRPRIVSMIEDVEYGNAMAGMATLRTPIDTFFEQVTVNDPNPALRANRLRLLASLRDTLHLAADFSKIEG